jgi:signal transduction histidine kinase
VADNGPGLNLPDTSVIFRPFFTTKPTGTGVGLSVARQAVILHGGDIVARNDPSGGAVVTLHL